MLYRIIIEKEYLKADLFNRSTVEETQEFFDAVAASARAHKRSQIMISVHSSSTLFAVERSGFLARFKKVSVDPSHKIALVADTEELGFSHQYMEGLAQRQGINVKNFRDERSGIAWFRAGCMTAGELAADGEHPGCR